MLEFVTQFATLDDVTDIMAMFKKHRYDVFPYFRKDYLIRKINEGKVIYHNGVVIIFGIYKKGPTIGNVKASKGDAYISEIISLSGKAQEVLMEFETYIRSPSIWLTVRADNTKACSFYNDNGFKIMSEISWKKGTIPGLVYCKILRERIS